MIIETLAPGPDDAPNHQVAEEEKHVSASGSKFAAKYELERNERNLDKSQVMGLIDQHGPRLCTKPLDCNKKVGSRVQIMH